MAISSGWSLKSGILTEAGELFFRDVKPTIKIVFIYLHLFIV